MLTPQRFAQAAEIFLRASEIPEESRDSYLDSSCGGDTELRSEIEGLLAGSTDRGDEFCESRLGLGLPNLGGTLAQAAGEIPAYIGTYRVSRLVGEGGMGRVYEAWQEKPRRRVAVKVMRPEYDSVQVARRFDLEAEILGTLRHPSIAQVIEAGSFEQFGRSRRYFAMEFVEGESLKSYVGSRALDVRRKMELIARACDGVEHAHRNGIVHRDLKPSNILVSGDGSLKILDFGIARHLAAADQDLSMQTMTGQIMGTLAYMSPEQVAGRHASINAGSDVYSLGVMAYELLVERLPHEVHNVPLAEAARRITDHEPPRLATLDKRLAGDLDGMVGKCLEKDPASRYATAAEFAADIRAYLANEPIRARTPSTLYQLKKFVRRKPGLTGSLVAAVLALVAGTGVASWQAVKAQRAAGIAEQETTKAQRELTRANAVKGVLSAMITSIRAEDAQGYDTQLMKLILNTTAERLDASPLADPLIEAELRQMLGKTYRIVGDFAKSKAMLGRALAIRKEHLGDDHLDTLESLHEFGHVCLDTTDWAEATEASRQAFEARARILGESDLLTIESHSNYASALASSGKNDEAVTHFRQLVALLRREYGNDHEQTLQLMNNLGVCMVHGADVEEAKALLQETLDGYRRVFGDESPNTITAMQRYADAQYEMGNLPEAEKFALLALDGARKALGPDHPDTLQSLATLGVVRDRMGDSSSAEEAFREALAGRRRRLGMNHQRTLLSIANLANCLRHQNKLDEAEVLYREALELAPRLYGENDPDTMWLFNNLGVTLVLKGQFDAAEPYLREAFDRRLRVLGADNPDTLASMMRLVDVLHRSDRIDEAAAITDPWEAAARRNWGAGKDDRQLGQFLSEMGEIRKRRGLLTQAESPLNEARQLLVRGYGEQDRNVITCTTRLAELHERWELSAPGSGHAEKALSLRRELKALAPTR